MSLAVVQHVGAEGTVTRSPASPTISIRLNSVASVVVVTNLVKVEAVSGIRYRGTSVDNDIVRRSGGCQESQAGEQQ